MMLLVFLIFAGCAVKCDDANNYYVIERPSDEPLRDLKPFQVYWNVPSMQCRSKKIPFESLFERYGIIQNKEDSFQGEQVTILYDPGLFPAILKDDSSGKLKFRNGGVPQEGNLDEHLTAFRYVVEHTMPDPEYNGIAIIDFESWRPVFRQNFGELTPYKNTSLLIERRLHPWWSRARIEAEARYRFERSGREFMQATLSLAKLLRPAARWGYYGFPYCFNMASNNPVEACPGKVQGENDLISWLWSESTALYPSVYSSRSLSSGQLAALVRGRVTESARVGRGAPILPYFWFRYRDAGFMSETDLRLAVKTMYKSNAAGFIIWGSSNDVNTVTKCEKLQNYLEQVLGPTIAQYTKKPLKDEVINQVVNDTTFNITTENPFELKPNNTEDEKTVSVNNTDQNHVFKRGESNDNITEDISQKLVHEVMVNETNIKENELNNGILIDILLSIIENLQNSGNKELLEKEMKRINKDRKKGTLIHDSFTKLTKEDYDLSTEKYSNFVTKKANIFTKLFTTSVTPEINSFTETSTVTSTTDHDDQSTTTEIWSDSNTFYNENTFTEHTPLTDEITDTLYDDIFDVELNDEATTVVYNYTGIATETNNINTDIAESVSTTTEGVSTTDGTISTMGELNDSLNVASENQVDMSVE